MSQEMTPAKSSTIEQRTLSDVAEDLRTSLNVVAGLSAKMLDELSGAVSEEQSVQLKMALEASSYLCELVDSAIQPGDLPPLSAVDAGAVCQSVAGWMKPRAEAKGLLFRADIAGSGAVARTDRLSLTRVLVNLLDNAIKFTRTGSVVVSLRVCDDTLILVVTDTGVGIAPEHLSEVFEESFQADPQTSAGVGHGLAVCRRLVEAIGGRLTVDSVVGQGSTFTVRFPAVSDAQRP